MENNIKILRDMLNAGIQKGLFKDATTVIELNRAISDIEVELFKIPKQKAL
jgi:hypothetical protein